MILFSVRFFFIFYSFRLSGGVTKRSIQYAHRFELNNVQMESKISIAK